MRLEILRMMVYRIPSGDHHSCRWATVLILIYEIIIFRNQMTLLDLQGRFL